MRAFYWRWLKTACRPTLGHTEFWSGVVGALFGVVDHYLPGAQLMSTYGWSIFIWSLAAITLVRFLLAPYWMWKEDDAKRSARVATADILPDWTIQELFCALDPALLEGSNSFAVGQAARDHFALGRLKCWGRPVDVDAWLERMVGWHVEPVPEIIQPEYWRDADLTYSFLGEYREFAPHAAPARDAKVPAYADLQVNKAEALSLDWSQIKKFKQRFAELAADAAQD